jgi:AP-1 complex subunit gamma-1
MKLTASPHFPEKRIGYLGMMLLLSEQADVLMLSTNALKNDLNSENKFVAGLALCAIGNLATADMSRDLAPEVEKHLKSPLSYLRKKACLAMARCLSKCPDMVEDFVERVLTLLKDKSHGVLITVVQLMTQVLIIDARTAEEEGEDPMQTECRKAFLRLVPTLVKMLRNLLSSGYSPDHDVGGISDPFLQVQLLTLLRLLGTNNEQASEEMNDVLAQVATNTETAKNAGNAILYECVQTIMGVQSEDGLRVLAVNILGRFLLNRDNNIRYVALNTLSRCIQEQKQAGEEMGTMIGDVGPGGGEGSAKDAMSALQRHRTTVVDCLKDPDISIRQRALELIYHLVNESNVEMLTAELLNYLVLCPKEHRADICTRILKVVDRFSPDDRWRVDTLITTLTIAGREATRDVQSATVVYISRASSDIHAFATHKLLKAIRDDDGAQHGLLSVGIWCIGEYGDMLLRPYSYSSTTPTKDGDDLTNGGTGEVTITFMGLDAMSIVKTVENVCERHGCPNHVKERALTAYAKLSQRLENSGDAAALNKLQDLLQKHRKSRSLEIQLRSCEYNTLISASRGKAAVTAPSSSEGSDSLFGISSSVANGDSCGSVSESVRNAAREAISRMPVVDIKVLQKRLSTDDIDGDVAVRAPRSVPAAKTTPAAGGDLLDLADIFGGATASATPTHNGSAAPKPVSGASTGKSDIDLLSDIFSAPATTTLAPAPGATAGGFDLFSAPAQPQAAAPVNPLDLFGAPPPSSSPGNMNVFGSAPPLQQQSNLESTSSGGSDPFGTMTSDSPVAPAQPTSIRVPAFSHAGLSAEFECTKPEPFNQHKSVLIAHFTNTTGDQVHGLNFQVAVPKYVTMEMAPPSSTTVPVSGGQGRPVTQRITVTNSMLGTKNLMLKLKVSFTSKGQKFETLATCSGFPAGKY